MKSFLTQNLTSENGFFNLNIFYKKDSFTDVSHDTLYLEFNGELWNNTQYLLEEVYPWCNNFIEDKKLDRIFKETEKKTLKDLFDDAIKIGMIEKSQLKHKYSKNIVKALKYINETTVPSTDNGNFLMNYLGDVAMALSLISGIDIDIKDIREIDKNL